MPIVYDGVDVNAGDQGEGNDGLFHGIKFWISHRVPMRETFVKLVQNNGGEIVRLEKFSDMMIADHARRAAGAPPPGSYSWKWIENSVNNGALEDKSAYLIGRSVDNSRQAGSAEPAKSSRTPFTENDDLILTKWVLNKGTSSGMNATQGNAIYQELERRHPHHTWQSWRSRWVKHLRDRTGGMAQYERGETPSPPPRPVLRPETLDEPEPSISVAPSLTQESQELPEPASSEPLARQRRVPFTPEEDDMLIAYVRQANLEGKRIKGNEIYKEFAGQHNSHTWQSWRDRWVKHLSYIPAEHAEAPRPPVSKSSQGDSQLISIAMAARALFRELSPTESAAPGAHVAEATQQPNPKSDDERLRAHSQQRMERIAAKLLQRTWRGYTARRDFALLMAPLVSLQSVMRGYLLRSSEIRVVSLQAIMRGHLVRMKIAEEFREVIPSVDRVDEAEDTIEVITQDTPGVDDDNELENITQDPAQAKLAVTHGNQVEDMSQKSPKEKPAVDGHDRYVNTNQGPAKPTPAVDEDDQNDMAEDFEDPDTTTIAMTQPADAEKSRFYKDLRDYAEVSECIIDMHPIIYKRAIDVWDLFRAATLVDNQSGNRNWQRIAETLGFGEEAHPRAAQQLQMFFDHNLADFEDAIQAFDNADVVVEEFEEQAPGDNQSEASSASLPDQDMISHPKGSLIHQQSPTVRSSPPETRNKRPRKYEELITSDLSYPPSGLKKRRRLDSGSVIPSTPEEKLGLSGTNRTIHSVHEESSPLKSRIDVAQRRIVANANESPHMRTSQGARDAEVAVDTRAQSPLRTRVRGQRSNTDDEQIVRSSIEVDGATPLRQHQARVGQEEGQHPLAPKNLTHLGQDRGRIPSTSTLQHVASDDHDSIVVASHSRNPFSSRIATQAEATKRTLPSQYVQKPVSIAVTATPVVAPKPNGSANTHPRNGMNSLAYSTAVPRKATVNGQRGNPRLTNVLPPTPSMPRPMPRTAALPAVQGYRLGEPGSSSNAKPAKLDIDYVSDVYTHFQRLGYAESDIVVASNDASCQPRLMSVVLESLAKGREVPQNQPGIWTKVDKEEMNMIRHYQRRIEKGGDIPGLNDRARVRIWQARNRLEAKHGESGLERRNQFLDVMQR